MTFKIISQDARSFETGPAAIFKLSAQVAANMCLVERRLSPPKICAAERTHSPPLPCGSGARIWAHRRRGPGSVSRLQTLIWCCYFPQQCLNFFPLLQGQGSLRPTLGPTRTGLAFSNAAAASVTRSLPRRLPGAAGAAGAPLPAGAPVLNALVDW